MSDAMHVIPLPDLSTPAAVKDVETQSAQWLLEPATLHVFDFGQVVKIDPNFYRMIAVYRRALNKADKSLASINLSAALQVTVNQMGLSHVFNAVDGVASARKLAGLAQDRPKVKLDAGMLAPFIEGTVNTISTQAAMTVTVGKPRLKDASGDAIAIAGVIQMNNPELPGSIALGFPKASFLGIYESMVGEVHTEITADIQDAAGELLNIIYGHAKTKLKAGGFAVDMAIPVILVGEQMKVQIGEKNKSIVVPFDSPRGPFFLEIYLKK